MNPTLREVAALASRQHGVVTRAEAVRLGASPMQIHRWLQREQIERLGRRSLTFPGQPQTWPMLLRAALNDAGEGALVSHRAAACLHQFDGFDEGPVEVITAVCHKNRQMLGVLHTSISIPRIDRAEVHGFPCTSAARTVVDLATCCSDLELENAIDSAIRNGGASAEFLMRVLTRHRGSGRAGSPKLDEVLVDSGATNKLERRFLQICRKADLPRPKCQVVHKRGSQTVARVDFDFWPSPLIVEVEGQIGHASPRQRQRDAKRRRDLPALGRLVLPFTYEDVFGNPDYVVSEVTTRLFPSLDIRAK